MKRWIPAVAVLLLVAAAPAFALDTAAEANRPHRTVIVVSDVIRMAQAGVSDDAIISYVDNYQHPFDITADDIIAMTDAHVSPAVIRAVQNTAASWKQRAQSRPATRSTVFVAPYYDPWFYPYSYNPYFYGPPISFGIGFGFFHGGFHGGFRGGFHGHR